KRSKGCGRPRGRWREHNSSGKSTHRPGVANAPSSRLSGETDNEHSGRLSPSDEVARGVLQGVFVPTKLDAVDRAARHQGVGALHEPRAQRGKVIGAGPVSQSCSEAGEEAATKSLARVRGAA